MYFTSVPTPDLPPGLPALCDVFFRLRRALPLRSFFRDNINNLPDGVFADLASLRTL